MKMKRTVAPASFGQARAQKLNSRLQKAVKERQKLARAQAAAEKPMDKTLEKRGDLVGRKIDRLSSNQDLLGCN